MDPSLIYTVDVTRLSQMAPDLPREAIRVATLFDGKRRLWEVLRDSFLTSRMTVSVFGRLRELQLVRVLPAEPILQATPAPVIQPAPAPVAPPMLEVDDRADTLVTEPPTAAIRYDFDDADHAFFDSYEPEDSSVDTFWDLEENPRKQRAARALQRRLSRRSSGGWFASLLLS